MLNCKICGNQGVSIVNFLYDSFELTNFLKKFYKSNHHEMQNLLKGKCYNILFCKSCEFIWQKFIPDENFLKLLYQKFIDKDSSLQKHLNNKNKFKNRFIYEIKNIIFLLRKKDLKKIKILDYGSGWGGWINEAKEFTPNVDGLEFSSSKIDYLTANKINVISINNLVKKESYYDFIRCEQVLEHLPDLKDFFDLICKISKPNSYLYIAVPNSSKLMKNKCNINILLDKGPTQPLEHLNSFSPKSLDRLAGKYGFKKMSILKIFHMYLSRNWFSLKNIKNLINNISNQTFNTVKIYQKDKNYISQSSI